MLSPKIERDWFYRILEIRKKPDTVSQEEVLKMADDLVLFSFGYSAPEDVVNFGLEKARDFTINNRDD